MSTPSVAAELSAATPPVTTTATAPSARPSAPGGDDLPIWETPAAPAAPAPVASPPPVAAKPAEAPAEPAPDDRVTRGLADMARREAAVRAQEAAVKRATRLEELRKSDPIAFLEESGLTYEQLTNSYLDKMAADPAATTPEAKADAALRKAQAIEARLAEAQTAQAEAQRQEQVRAGIAYVTTTINAVGDKYEHVNSDLGRNVVFESGARGAHAEIFNRAALHFQRHQVEPDLEAIAAEVEKEIEDRFAKPVLSLKRYAKPAVPAAPPSTGVPRAQASVGSHTLSNATASEGPNGPPPLPLDPDERDRALNADPAYRIWG